MDIRSYDISDKSLKERGALVNKVLKGKIRKYGKPKEPACITKVRKMLGGDFVVTKTGTVVNTTK